jgi:single-stranded DNA-binding protein
LALNHVVLSGKVADPGIKLSYSITSKPEAKLTLIVSEGKGDQVFNLYIPVFVYGNGAEVAAAEVDPGDLIACDGRLGWKSTPKKDGTKLGLCVTTFGVEILVKAEVPVAPGDIETEPEPESAEPPPKARRRGYPRQALAGGFDQN